MNLIDFILHFDNHLQSFISSYGAFVYGILFLIIFCETGLVFLPLLPGDSLIFAAGSFVAMGQLNYFALLVLIIIASIIGDSVNYYIGNKFGNRIINSRKIKLIKKEHIDKSFAFVEKYGAKAVFLARFMPIIRTMVPFVLGMGQMEYKKFLKFNILGGILWVSLFINLGYFFGNIKVVKEHFSLIILAIIFISLMPIMYSVVRSIFSKRKVILDEEKREN